MAKRVRFKARFFVFIFVLIALLALVLFLIINSGRKGELDNGTVTMAKEISAIVIRDESSVTVEKYDRVNYFVNEGAAVAEGTAVAEVYKYGYSEDMRQAIITLEKQVLFEQRAILDGIEDSTLETIDLQIEQKEINIRDCVMGSAPGDLLALGGELNALLDQRETYLRGAVQPNEALNALYAELDEKNAQLATWKSDVIASSAGVVSFYFDGYEQALSAAKLDMVNSDMLRTVIKSATGGASGSASNLLYRTVKPDHWYIVFVTEKTSAWRVVGGESYTIEFSGKSDAVCDGVALAPVMDDSGVVNIIEFSSDIGSLLSLRNVKATVKKTAEGVRVPSSAVSVKDGAAYITAELYGEDKAIEVDIVAENEEYSIIRAKNAGDAVGPGMDFKEP